MIAYINGDFLENPKISFLDHSFLYGDGCFDTLRAYNGKIFRLNEHIERLKSACLLLEIKPPDIDYEKILYKLLSLNNLKNAILRLTISRGEGLHSIDPDLCVKPTIIAFAREFSGYPYEDVDAVVLEIKKSPKEVLPPIKSNNYLNNILAKIEAKKKGVREGIFLTTDGFVACGITSNLFIVKDKSLITPSLTLPIIPGITRKAVIEIANSLGIEVFEDVFSKEELYNADEIFLTSTGYEIMPVIRIDGQIVKDGKPGKTTKSLLKHFREIVK